MRSVVLFPGLAPTSFAAIGDFLESSGPGRRRVAAADEVLGYSLLAAFRDAEPGPGQWAVYDCAYLACTLALADHLHDQFDGPAGFAGDPGQPPVACAGLSFGGFPAAVYAGGVDYAEAIRLVSRSAERQARYLATWPEPAGCHFFYRLDRAAVEEIVAELRAAGRWIEISADLGLSVHAVSGSMPTLELVRQRVSERGGSPIYTMDRPQHCAAMAELRDELGEQVYSGVRFRAPAVPVVSDVDGALVRTAMQLSWSLLQGWTEPVHIQVTLDALARQRIERVYLVGPRTMFGRLLGDLFDVVVVSPEAVAAGPLPLRRADLKAVR
nr:ACP S-malonyltransferase [Micromonospora sp. DSM 115978]